MGENQPVSLLWTSGWDSTFRLLQLALLERREVQPYYMIDSGRRSTPIEMARMETIKGAIAATDPLAGSLVSETIKIHAAEVPEDASIKGKYTNLTSKFPIGSQYSYLAQIAEHLGLNRLELSVHVDDKLYSHLDGNVYEESDGVYALKPSVLTGDLGMLKYFRFPILNLTKTDMEEIARDRGFLHILELSWFCSRPDRKLRPCGICFPCTYAIEEGMGRRIPWQGHFRHRVWPFLRVLRRGARFMRDRIRGKHNSSQGYNDGGTTAPT